MDISIYIFITILLFSTYQGYRSGAAVILSKIFGLIIAYIATLLLTPHAAAWLQSISPVQGLLAYPVAGFSIFILSSTLFTLLAKIFFSRKQPDQFLDKGASRKKSSFTGGILGALIGLIIGGVSVWFIDTLQSINQIKKNQPFSQTSEFQQNIKELASKTLEGLVTGVSKQANLTTASVMLIANPAENIEHLNKLGNSGKFNSLLNNHAARLALDNRNPYQLSQQSTFQSLVTDPDFIALAEELKITDSSKQLSEEFAIQLTTIWTKTKLLQNDPRFIEITQDPEIKQMIHSKDFFGLLTNPEIEELLLLINSVETPEITFTVENLKQQPQPQEKVIHSWIDDKGVIHYSDEKPEQN